mmetsp:Transcript_18511/g.46385  ORF Transcript_18511/g.46385 Transcript_18511/m.46385 type:complete len:208 (+) Transcript_18511:831-1454(+)
MYGRPMFHHHLDRQILDALHLGALGLPKTPWKHGILNNASDDVREKIAAELKAINHPLDTRRKDDNRSRAQKWFTGEKWLSFCAGERGSPGGPKMIARIVKIIADDLEARGVVHGSGCCGGDVHVPLGECADEGIGMTGRARGRAAFTHRAMAKRASEAEAPAPSTALVVRQPEARHIPTQIEGADLQPGRAEEDPLSPRLASANAD